MKTFCIALGLCAITAQVSPSLGNSFGAPMLRSTDGLARPAGFGPGQPPHLWVFQDASAHEHQGILLSHGPGSSTGQGLFESTELVQSTMTVGISAAQLYAPEPATTEIVVRFASTTSPSGAIFPLGGMPEFDFQPVGNSIVGFLHFGSVQSLLWNRIFQKDLTTQTETLTWGNGPLKTVALPDSANVFACLASVFAATCWYHHRVHQRFRRTVQSPPP